MFVPVLVVSHLGEGHLGHYPGGLGPHLARAVHQLLVLWVKKKVLCFTKKVLFFTRKVLRCVTRKIACVVTEETIVSICNI